MHTIEIPNRNETYTVAELMHELTSRQYIEFCKVISLINQGRISQQDAEMKLLISFADIRFGIVYALMSRKQKEAVHLNLLQMTPLVRTVFVEKNFRADEKYLVPSIDFTDNKIHRYKGLTGPADALTNCTFFEYKQAYSAWIQYQETKQDEFLDEMIAVLYRPQVKFAWIRKRQRDFSGDSREPISVNTNPLILERRIRKVSGWPHYIKYGIWLWFTACMDFLRTGKPIVDGIELDLSILYKGEGGSVGIGLAGIIYSLAESGVFGDVEQTGNTNIYDVFARLYQVKLQMDQAKEKSKKHD